MMRRPGWLHRVAVATAVVGAAALAGCASVVPPAPQLDDGPVPFAAMPAPRAQAGGLFVPNSGNGLLSDQRAYRVGDVLTVMLEEVTQASKRADTNVRKGSKVEMPGPVIDDQSLLGRIGLSSNNNFNGGGSSSQQNALSGSMTVIVQQVLPNGLLHIKGDRALTLNQGDEVLKLSGYVRSTDVDPHNRVSSMRIANARISYSGHGALADANQAGWLTRFFQSPLFPF